MKPLKKVFLLLYVTAMWQVTNLLQQLSEQKCNRILLIIVMPSGWGIRRSTFCLLLPINEVYTQVYLYGVGSCLQQGICAAYLGVIWVWLKKFDPPSLTSYLCPCSTKLPALMWSIWVHVFQVVHLLIVPLPLFNLYNVENRLFSKLDLWTYFLDLF